MATLRVYSGSEWITVTGRIVKQYDHGGTIIDTETGVRWYAPGNNVMRPLEGNGLW